MRVNGKKEWGSLISFSHGTSNARGVAVLFKSKLDIDILQELSDSRGRLLVLNVKIKDKNYRLVNVYGPNKDAEAVRFYQNLSSTLRQMELDGDDNVIIGGDFNCPLDPTMDPDKKGEILIPRQHVINFIENIQNEFSLHDVWRVKNPNTRSFTWSKMSPFIFGRLDYWPISDSLHDLVTQVDILASIKTDHSSIALELQNIQEACRGPGFWKLNSSLLSRPHYVDKINNEFPVWLEAKDLSSTRSKWDWIKFNIRTTSITYSKKLKKDRKKREEELNSKYQFALKSFQENPNDANKTASRKLKK